MARLKGRGYITEGICGKVERKERMAATAPDSGCRQNFQGEKVK